MRRTLLTAAIMISALAAVGCGNSAPAINSHGSFTVSYDTGSQDSFSDGAQVVVIDSKGTVIGTGSLTFQTTGDMLVSETDAFTFNVRVPGGLPRYGVEVGGESHGTVWLSATQMRNGPALSVDETTG